MESKDELVEIDKSRTISREEAQMLGEFIGNGFSALSEIINKVSNERVENNYRKYEQQANICIAALQEETKIETARLETAKNYYSSFKYSQEKHQAFIDGYYSQLEDLKNRIDITNDEEKLKFYMGVYKNLQDKFESMLTEQNKVLNDSVMSLADETNKIINEGRRDTFLSKLAGFFTRK